METIQSRTSPRVKYVILLLIVSVVACGYAVIRAWPPELFYRTELRTGNMIISRVESFKAVHGHLPENLNEVGIANADSLNVFYRREGSERYIVWFGTTLGESMTYDSQLRKWQ